MTTITSFHILEVETVFDPNGRPACMFAGKKCMALRPKMYNEMDELVHYCGLGPWGQRPLRETSLRKRIVRPNKECPLHKTEDVCDTVEMSLSDDAT